MIGEDFAFFAFHRWLVQHARHQRDCIGWNQRIRHMDWSCRGQWEDLQGVKPKVNPDPKAVRPEGEPVIHPCGPDDE